LPVSEAWTSQQTLVHCLPSSLSPEPSSAPLGWAIGRQTQNPSGWFGGAEEDSPGDVLPLKEVDRAALELHLTLLKK